MIRITTHHKPSHTVVTIDGQLTAPDFRAIRRTRQSVRGAVTLNLGGLDACARDGIRLLQDWLDAGAQLDDATPFLRMVLQDRKPRVSREERHTLKPHLPATVQKMSDTEADSHDAH